jgi:hypothetical protein
MPEICPATMMYMGGFPSALVRRTLSRLDSGCKVSSAKRNPERGLIFGLSNDWTDGAAVGHRCVHVGREGFSGDPGVPRPEDAQSCVGPECRRNSSSLDGGSRRIMHHSAAHHERNVGHLHFRRGSTQSLLCRGTKTRCFSKLDRFFERLAAHGFADS